LNLNKRISSELSNGLVHLQSYHQGGISLTNLFFEPIPSLISLPLQSYMYLPTYVVLAQKKKKEEEEGGGM